MRDLEKFAECLLEEEKSKNTIDKYVRDVKRFLEYAGEEEITPGMVRAYKEELLKNYKVSSANSMLIALNRYLRFIDRPECRVRACRQQRRIFVEEERELSRKEYERLVSAARNEGKCRLYHILQTIAGTGIRIGELKYITVEALKSRRVQINSKGKVRVIVLSGSVVQLLKGYCQKARICCGSIFVTRNGCPVDRRNVWAEMKALCAKAGILKSKVFPHNLRHLFAKSFYEKEKDLIRLADFLGHSSVETTRRYTMISSMAVCDKQLELGLLFGGFGLENKKTT